MVFKFSYVLIGMLIVLLIKNILEDMRDKK